MFDTDQITGTLINYYATCKREAWLYAHAIHADQDDENIQMGKALSEIKESGYDSYFSHLHFDKIDKKAGHVEITEYKKSLKNKEAAKMQLLFYMYLLKSALDLRQISGKVISGKTVIHIEGSETNFETLKQSMQDIITLVNTPKPPEFIPIKWCKSCGYRDYCGV